MKYFASIIVAINICFVVYLPIKAAADAPPVEPLNSCFLNMGVGTNFDTDVMSEAQFESTTSPMASDAPDQAAVPDHRIFYGYLYPNYATCSLCILSDDGCNVTIDGNLVLKNFNKGQELSDLSHSLCKITPYNAVVGTPNIIQVDYSNIVYNGDFDIDGVTLMAYNGSAQVSQDPIAVVSIQDKLGTAHYSNAPIDPAAMSVTSGTTVSFRALNNTTSPSIWPTGVIPTWTISQPIGASLTSTPAATVGPSTASVTFTDPGEYKVTASYNSPLGNSQVTTTIEVIDTSTIDLSYTSLHAICTGGGKLTSESVHTGIVTVSALTNGVGIPNLTIGLDFSAALKLYCSTYPLMTIPTFANSTVTTDMNGNATTTITSGTAVLPAQYHCPISEAVLSLNGIIQPNANAAVQTNIPPISANAFYPGTATAVTDFNLGGDNIDLKGYINYTDGTSIMSHHASWHFRYFAKNPGANPLSNMDYLYDDILSGPETEDENGLTLYGEIFDRQNPVNPGDPYYANYESGTIPGYIYWYLNDDSVQLDDPTP